MSPTKTSKTGAQPFVKWAGGKRQLLPELRKRVPASYRRYHEPFVGAGALFFDLKPSAGVYLSDANTRLIRTYKALQSAAVTNVIHALHRIAEAYSDPEGNRKAYFEQTREACPDEGTDVEMAAWFIFMNKTCFNGMYRVNKDNTFNVPHGRHKNVPMICDEANLMAVNEALDFKTFISNADFRTSAQKAKEGDFVYFDPPYAPVSATADFTTFTADGFTEADQSDLRDLALSLKRRGVHVLISNSNAEPIRKLYTGDEWTIDEVEAKRSINSKGNKRGPVIELLIS